MSALLSWLLLATIAAIITVYVPWKRWPTVLLLLGSFAAGGLVVYQHAAGPMPHAWETRTGEAQIVAAHAAEGRGIWLWLLWPGDPVPRSYELPWSDETRDQLAQAMRAVEGEGGHGAARFGEEPDDREQAGIEGGLSLPFELSLEPRSPPMLYAVPHPAPPAKPGRRAAPQFRMGPGA